MSQVQAAGARVLIVDDSATMRGLLRSILLQESHEVVGELASDRGYHEALVELRPQIVCLDNHLPGTSGLELLRLTHASHPRISVILITGDTDPALDDIAAEAGAAGFIRKPFTADEVIRNLRQVTHAQRLLSQRENEVQASAQASAVSVRATAVIADDSATMRMLLSAILQSAGVHVVGEAWDGEQAIRMAAEHRPDIVCLDLEMPVKSGLEALRAIHSAQPGVKTLMVTGSASREAVVQAIKLGANGYLLKPFQPEGVIAAINKLLIST